MQFEVQAAAQVVDDGLPPTGVTPSMTPAQARGLRYQARVEGKLLSLYPGRVLVRPWFRYRQNHKVRRCQPDALIFNPDQSRLLVLEIKYSTIPEAWEKLSKVYVPVLKKAHRISVLPIFITRMFDPHVGWTVPITQLEGLERLDEWNGEGLGVVSWK